VAQIGSGLSGAVERWRMKGAVGYARVSTDEQAKENNSLAVQSKRIAHYCEQHGLPLLRTIQGSESARTMLQRPFMEEMLRFCRENKKKISRVIVSDLSRLARNVHDQAQIIVSLRQMSITLVSIDEPLTDDSAMGELVRNMLASINQFFSDALSERTRTRMQAAVQSGRFLWPAPVGYVNLNKRLIPDPERAPLVREAFQLVASGRHPTTDSVLKIVTAMGLTSKKGRPLTKSTFARLLSNPIYAGWVVSGEIKAQGSHEPLVSEELFQQVQDRINLKSTPHKKISSEFPLRGIVLCATCKRPLTAGWAKGRTQKYPRYWCWTPKCRSVGISREKLEWLFVNLLSMMQPTAEYLAQLPELAAARWKTRKEKIAQEAARLSKRLADQKALNQRAVTARIKNEISADDLEAFKKGNDEEIQQIESAITALDSERNTMEELVRQAVTQSVNLVRVWENSNSDQRQELAKSFFPDGLYFSHELKFFEPGNTVITEMIMHYLEHLPDDGVPGGI
jgi:site-specific DNA recombinase